MDDRGFRVRFSAGLGIFLFTTASRTALGSTQPPIQRVPGALSLGIKRPGREAYHSPPSSAEVKEWVELHFHSHNTPSWRGDQLKHRDNFNFISEDTWPLGLDMRILQWTIGILGFDSQRGLGTFILTASRPDLRTTQPPIQWVPGPLSLGVKQLRREADHSPPSSSKVKNAWSNTSTPPYAFMPWCSVKAQGQFYFHIWRYVITGPRCKDDIRMNRIEVMCEGVDRINLA
jgi:hypothetical protein